MLHRFLTSLSLFFNVLAAVGRARLANRTGSNKWVPLSSVAPVVNTSLSIDKLVARVDRIVRLFIMNTAHPCLYFSYARCRVLRSWGYNAKLNIGLHNLQCDQKTDGHCWISLDGQVLLEESDPHDIYPDRMGERNHTVYWARLQGEEGKTPARLKRKPGYR